MRAPNWPLLVVGSSLIAFGVGLLVADDGPAAPPTTTTTSTVAATTTTASTVPASNRYMDSDGFCFGLPEAEAERRGLTPHPDCGTGR